MLEPEIKLHSWTETGLDEQCGLIHNNGTCCTI